MVSKSWKNSARPSLRGGPPRHPVLSWVGSPSRVVSALLHMHEGVRALKRATVLPGAGLLAWLLLMQIVLIH